MPQTREHILLARQVSVPAMLRTDKGRRKTPFFNGYKPEFFFRTTDVTSQVALGDEVQMVMPGDNARIEVGLDKPIAVNAEAISPSGTAAKRSGRGL